jgi:AcrR family transcriptional regulator
MAKKNASIKRKIVNAFTDHVLKHGAYPKSVYAFAEELGMKEAQFYSHFGAFEAIEEYVFTSFFENTMSLLEKDDQYQSYQAKDKLLSFYFTFFEVLTANRSYVRATLGDKKDIPKKLKVLGGLRHHFKHFISTLDIPSLDLKQGMLEEIQERGMFEMAWNQLLITMKFWLDDTSANFEKTDIFIEKSINTSFELMRVEPLESLIDFGKFLVKETLGSRS